MMMKINLKTTTQVCAVYVCKGKKKLIIIFIVFVGCFGAKGLDSDKRSRYAILITENGIFFFLTKKRSIRN